jgi:hypothetical protein
MPCSQVRSNPTTSTWIVIAMLAMIVIPAAITLETVRQPVPLIPVNQSSTPYGYTWSLLLFIIPAAVIVTWFLLSGSHLPRRASLWTLSLLIPLGWLLDFGFAQWFFDFPNHGATLGISAFALGKPVPLEEYFFYLTGFLTVLLLYVWFGEFWLAAYQVADYPGEARKERRLLRFHPTSLVLAVVLIGAAWFCKKHLALPADRAGFPGYFTFLVAMALLPAIVFFPVARRFINWRALSLTLFFMLLVSLLWEATLAVPYNWWNFQHRQMMGIFFGAWSGLPIEEVVVWVGVSYATVIIYEVMKVGLASERSLRDAMLGSGNRSHGRAGESE